MVAADTGQAAGTGQEAEDWLRLSPLTLLLAVVRLGPKSLNMIPAVAAIGISADWRYAAIALLVFLLFSLGFAWAAWMRFRWRIASDAIIIESGIFDRQHRTIPFDRIQDVSIEQGLVARMLDLAKVGFETGASAEADKADGGLDSITIEDAAALRSTIRDWRGHAAVVAVPEADGGHAVPEEVVLYRLTPRRLILAGLFNFSLAAFAVVVVAAQWFDDFLPSNIVDPRVWMDAAREAGVERWIEAHRWASAFAAIAAFLFVGFATGLIRTALVNWNFQLSLGPRSFRRVRGLLTRTDVAIPLARVQAAVVATGILRRRWGWYELRLQSLASDGKDEKDHQLIPFAKLDDIDAALDPLRLARPDPGLEWHRPSLWAQSLGGVLGAGMVAMGGLALILFGSLLKSSEAADASRWVGPLLILGAGLAWLFQVITAGYHRWSVADGQLFVWRGWYSPRLTILPFANVQSVDLANGPVLRRLGAVRVDLGVPGESGFASHSIDAVPLDQALHLRRSIIAMRTRRA